ncbi:MAG: hypothetical protein IT447_01510 [Phycisphaerales bacterium]|jgi:hypothetical protein|nr:hypothetical protein [Phycisphaerales bacterium]
MAQRRAASSDSTSSHPVQAGVARIEITSQAPDARVLDPLYARALVLDDGQTQLVLLTMDVTSIGGRKISDNLLPDVSEEFLPTLRGRVERELGIAGKNVLVNASHTHPLGRMLCDDQEQLKRTFEVIRQARQNMVPVKIGVGSGRADRISMNRTLNMKDGRHWTIRHTNPSPTDQEVAGVAPFDPQIGIIRIDRMEGGTLAVIFNFACHLLFGDPTGAITGNYPAVAQRVIEQSLEGEATTFFVQGAAGDVIDMTFKDFHHVRRIEPIGWELAEQTIKALRQIKTDENAKLNVVSKTLKLPWRKDFDQCIAQLQAEGDQLLESLRYCPLNFKNFLPLYLQYQLHPDYPLSDAYRYMQADLVSDPTLRQMDKLNRANLDKYLQNIRSMEKLARIRENIDTLRKHQRLVRDTGSQTVDAEIQLLRIGDGILVGSPLEVLTEVSLRVKKASPFPNTFIAAFSNGYLHYGSPVGNYDKGGYEVVECPLAPQWQEMYERTVGELLREL